MPILKLFLAVLSCFFLALSTHIHAAAGETGLTETEAVKEGDDGQIGKGEALPCVRALLPSWIKTEKFIKSKGFIFDMKECRISGNGTVCTFSVINCSGRDAWLYLDKTSYMSDDTGGNYELQTKEFGGKTAAKEELVKAFIQSGDKEDGSLVFEKVSNDAEKLNIGIVVTGGAWAGNTVKALFRNIPLTH